MHRTLPAVARLGSAVPVGRILHEQYLITESVNLIALRGVLLV